MAMPGRWLVAVEGSQDIKQFDRRQTMRLSNVQKPSSPDSELARVDVRLDVLYQSPHAQPWLAPLLLMW
jgi:hypothetical protein